MREVREMPLPAAVMSAPGAVRLVSAVTVTVPAVAVTLLLSATAPPPVTAMSPAVLISVPL